MAGCNKRDNFKVKEITYSENRKINKLMIVKVEHGNEVVVYEYGTGKPKVETKAKSEPSKPKTDERVRNIDLKSLTKQKRLIVSLPGKGSLLLR